jgi:hypothetical protein
MSALLQVIYGRPRPNLSQGWLAERVLCNRCATTIENAHYNCGSCSQDFCVSCVTAARGPQKARPGPGKRVCSAALERAQLPGA